MVSMRRQLQAEERRNRIIEFLISKGEGYRASYGEIARVVGASKSTIQKDLATLVETGGLADYANPEDLAGALEPEEQSDDAGSGRTGEEPEGQVPADESAVQGLGPRVARRYGLPPRLPVLGRVRAGSPNEQEAVELHTDSRETLIDALKTRDGDYVLRVTGDSMVEVGVQDGDFIVIHPQEEAPPNGTIVLAQVHVGDDPGTAAEEATTLKRFYQEAYRVRLQPANDQYEPQYYNDPTKVKVRGVMIKVIRVLVA